MHWPAFLTKRIEKGCSLCDKPGAKASLSFTEEQPDENTV